MAAGAEGPAVFGCGVGFAARFAGNAAAGSARIRRPGESTGDGPWTDPDQPSGIHSAVADHGARETAQEQADEDGGWSAAGTRAFDQRRGFLAEAAAVGTTGLSPFAGECLFAGDGRLRGGAHEGMARRRDARHGRRDDEADAGSGSADAFS